MGNKRKLTAIMSVFFVTTFIISNKSPNNAKPLSVIPLTFSEENNLHELFESEIRSLSPLDYTIDYIAYCKDFYDNNFAVAKFLPSGYAIYNINTGDFFESSTITEFSYSKEQIENSLYFPLEGFYYKENLNEYVSLSTNQKINNKDIKEIRKNKYEVINHYNRFKNVNNINFVKGERTLSNDRLSSGHIYLTGSDSEMPKAQSEVPYSWFFRKCFNYPRNTNGHCGYVALSILLFYYEVCISAGYFSEAESSRYITPFNGLPEKGCPSLSFDFINELRPNAGATNAIKLGDEVDAFLKNKGLNYDCITSYWLFGKSVPSLIRSGYPLIYCGRLPVDDERGKVNHCAVAYGVYDDGDLLCHYGWANTTSNYSQVKISQAGFFEQGSILRIEHYGEHICKPYFTYRLRDYCACYLEIF